MKLYTNNKTGDDYSLLNNEAINTTNAYDGERMVIYRKYKGSGQVFVRTYVEFHSKFKRKGDS